MVNMGQMMEYLAGKKTRKYGRQKCRSPVPILTTSGQIYMKDLKSGE